MSRRQKPGKAVRLRIDVSVVLPKPIDSVPFLGSPEVIMGEIQQGLAEAMLKLLPDDQRDADGSVSLTATTIKLSVDRRVS